jgi:phosphatidate phosphatase APP1
LSRPHQPPFAARTEDRVTRAVTAVLSRRGWIASVVPFTSYGGDGWIRVVGRAVLGRPRGPRAAASARGWRAFFTAPLHGAVVSITVPGYSDDFTASADRQGYLDLRLEALLPPGWHELQFRIGDGPTVAGRINIVDPAARFGLVSDIDDTAVITALPRPFVAAWNTFAVHEHARRPVPGMAEFYQAWLAQHPGAPTFYLSTGAWNTHALLARFLTAHGYPAGPLLLTDWGPTNTGFFRSGPEHKRTELRRLALDFPHIQWLLVGDDGQHDPLVYTQFASEHPDNVDAIGIRELTPGEHVLAHGLPVPAPDSTDRREVPVAVQVARGADGHELAWALIPERPDA